MRASKWEDGLGARRCCHDFQHESFRSCYGFDGYEAVVSKMRQASLLFNRVAAPEIARAVLGAGI